MAEAAGVPTASLVCDGFAGQAASAARGLGIPALPVARIVGHVDAQSVCELESNVRAVSVDAVLSCLTGHPAANDGAEAFGPFEAVAKGSLEEVQEAFEQRGWSDGLPFVPPTAARVRSFVERSGRCGDDVIGVMKSSGTAATVHNVAVNAVMAGCRAEYMPLLLAVAEVLTDPHHGAEHSGDTTCGETQIIVSGPIVRALGFNTAEGALRDGHRANSSVGRFLRLYLRNVANFLPGGGDKSTFGHTFRTVLAEDGEAMTALGWPGFGADHGFAAHDSVVALARFTGDTVVGSIYGDEPGRILDYLADGLVRQHSWELVFAAGLAAGTSRPLLVISPLVADTLKRAGLSKAQLKQSLFERARLPARRFETYVSDWCRLVAGEQTLREMADDGAAAPVFVENDDPARLVPIVARAEDIQVVVSGDPRRSNAMAHGSNGMHGMLTCKRVVLPG